MPPPLSLLIVNYNTAALLRECLESARPEVEAIGAEVVVVDNASPDGSADMVARDFPWVRLLRNTFNVGYATAINQAMEEARSELFFILNADILFPEGSIARLIEFAEEHPEAGIIGPRLVYPDGRLQYSCRTFYTLPILLLRRTSLGRLFPRHPLVRDHLMTDFDHESVREVDWVLGAAMVVNKRAVEEVGPMDGRYFLYLEDVDWCFRMHQAGWKVLYCPGAEITHYYRQGSREGGLLERDVLVHVESAIRYYDKWSRLLHTVRRYLASVRSTAWALLDAAILAGSCGVSKAPVTWLPVVLHYPVARLRGLGPPLTGEAWSDVLGRCALTMMTTLVLTAALPWAAGRMLPPLLQSRADTLFAFVAATLLLSLTRSAAGTLRKHLSSRRLAQTRVIIAGTDERAREIARRMASDLDLGYDVAGFVGPKSDVSPRLGTLEDLPGLVPRERIQEAVFVRGEESLEDLLVPIVECRRKGVHVRVVLHSPEGHLFDLKTQEFCDELSLDLPGTPLEGLSRLVKRTIDITLSLLLLALTLPLMAAIALILGLRRRGPVLETETRLGRDAEPFEMLRFRTGQHPATDDPDEESGQEDVSGLEPPPDGPFEAFLRRHKLDEIPQLWNVLSGEMSLVGPRPPLPQEVPGWHPWHRARFQALPGITGLWQVDKERKWRFDQMMQLDLFYILNWSPRLDAQILFRTVGVMLTGTR